MMTRRCPRRDISRSPHSTSPKRPPIRDSPLHYFRSFLLCRLLLSLLPLKPCPHPRTGRHLTPSRNHYTRPLRSTPTQHCCTPSIRCYSYLSSPQHYRGRTKTSNPVPGTNHPSRLLLHLPSSTRILRGPLHNRRRSLRLNFLRSNRIPRPPRHHRLHIPSHLPTPTNPVSLYI